MLNFVVAPRSRKTRGPTVGKMFVAKLAGMESRFRLSSIVGGRRPLDPEESCKLASDVGIFVRNEIPIFPTWKEHVDTSAHFEKLVHRLHVSHLSPGNVTHTSIPHWHVPFLLACCWLYVYRTNGLYCCEQLRFEFDEDQEEVKRVLNSLFSDCLRQYRSRLKKKYFIGKITGSVPTTSPLTQMTDKQWGDLVKHWSDPKNMV